MVFFPWPGLPARLPPSPPTALCRPLGLAAGSRPAPRRAWAGSATALPASPIVDCSALAGADFSNVPDAPSVVLSAAVDGQLVLATDDLVTGDDCFFVATGITDGDLMRGVRYRAGGCTTDSLVMRSRSGTIRKITSEHKLHKLSAFAAIDFDG